jgi:Concanavalin A-like lectin/glucanases superfamily
MMQDATPCTAIRRCEWQSRRRSGGVAARRSALALLLAAAALASAPAVARAAVVASWPLASNAADTSGGGHDGAVQNVVFGGGAAAFDGHATSITVPWTATLSPGTADLTASVEINTTGRPGRGDLDYDLMRAEPKGKMYKVELFPHGKVKAQAQCIFKGSQGKITLHAGPSLNDGQWHSIVCRKTADRVTLTIDGAQVGAEDIVIGSIKLRKNAPFALGYKPVPGGTDGDFYDGLMRNAAVAIG